MEDVAAEVVDAVRAVAAIQLQILMLPDKPLEPSTQERSVAVRVVAVAAVVVEVATAIRIKSWISSHPLNWADWKPGDASRDYRRAPSADMAKMIAVSVVAGVDPPLPRSSTKQA